ncbi:hypothetical protein SD70_06780 [Gordoniibacillus kamchatkensis]|uniref:DNA-binding response regulator n=1 Tax=Gordoniibacillus kamchatkensis TaxID=1590651 RepID=A0ABR5AL14_9BACL|nr:response regulator [Paenibacillus sp. VKM B-2647]KIL41558.1 hypothetical protein SD70_06780 [Paenibacillus sp. VKM B-2647]
MYKIIIVDDDEEVREGIIECIDWNSHGFEVAAECSDGSEALAAARKHKPDLILSDICMPYMDGIELARQIQTVSPHTKVIILTGYDDFDYAQQALRLKVYDFIVKPMTAGELRAMLDKVKLDMDREAASRLSLQQLSAKLHQSMPLLKERFLERLMNEPVSEDEVLSNLHDFGLPPVCPPCLVLTVHIDDLDKLRQERWRSGLDLPCFAAYNVALDVAEEKQAVVFRTREETIAVLLFGMEETPLYEMAFHVAEELRRCTETFLKFTVTIGIGEVCAKLGDLPRSYQSSAAAAGYRFVLGKNRIISIRDMEGASTAPKQPNQDWGNKFAALLKTGTSEEAEALVGQFIADLRSTLLPADGCCLHIQAVIIAMMNIMRELCQSDTPLFAHLEQTLADIHRFTTLHDTELWLKDLCCEAVSQLSGQRGDFAQAGVRSAIAYIEEHFADEHFSVRQVCRHVHLSKSYLSTIFKQQTDQTIMEFATRLRMEKAKELLLAPLKSYEVAAKVGYSDPQYFSVQFKKQTGLSPTEFRDRLTKARR